MQIFKMRYNLKFRKLTLYGLTRPQSIRKSKQIPGQTILSSLQTSSSTLILRKIATFQWLKIALHDHHASGVNDRYTKTYKVN